NRTEIKVPDIGDFDKVPVIEVLVSQGDTVDKEQSLITLESDKATMEVPSPESGKLVELRVSEDDEVGQGDVIGIVEVASEDAGDDAGDDQAEADGEGEDAAGNSDSAPAPAERPATAEDTDTAATESRSSQADAASAGRADRLPAPPVPFEAMDMDPSK